MKNGISPLHVAAESGFLHIVKNLCELNSDTTNKIDINIKDINGKTPLHYAIASKHVEVVQYLITLPTIDVQIVDNSYQTPLHEAVNAGSLDIIKLIAPLSNINAKDNTGVDFLTVIKHHFT